MTKKAEKSPVINESHSSKVATDEKANKIGVHFPSTLKQQQLDKQFAKFLEVLNLYILIFLLLML